ncbi:hypothetical protein GCK72_017156 [Caenorhabditis remanei]|uniref:SSD domain-containing protein n=1 Tax=Caenorhabditis remanei TaxID=31234 RepID=A0A6A5G7G5_CAERE|nr:hypothetical protein GCK72_017156 [Caenorhabditis remanei]KAF1750605.1 hypothetical protein GCK72_017156 [Caenorhabditis remanei]
MGWFDDKIHEVFYEVGVKVHRFRHYFLLLSFAILTFCSFGFLWFTEQTTNDPQYVFSPANAPWRYERAVLTEHWPLDEEKFWPGKSYDLHGYVDVIASGKVHPDFGRPNILNIRYLDEVARINDYIVHNLTVPVDINGKHYDIAYTDLCMRYDWACFLNDHITMLMPKTRWGNFSGPFAEFASDIINTQVNITYPIGWRGTEPIYFGALVGAPNLVDDDGHFDFATAIRLTYNTREGKVDEYGIEWRRKLAKWLTDKENPVSELLEFGVNHNMTLPEGLQDVADTLAPKFVGTCAILFTFSFLVSVVLRRHSAGQVMIDWVRSKPIVAAAGLMTPVMATVTSFGLILWCGCLYNAIVNVSPFLILCIGIDDLFIMSAEWHRTNPKDSAEKRIGHTLSEAAVAISITSITDITTFAVGCYTTLPGVQMFCMYTAVQCFFCYVYQIIFLGPVLAYAAEMEQNDQHALLFRKAVDPEKTNSKLKLWLLSGSVNRQVVRKRVSKKVTPVEEEGSEKKSKLGEMVAKLEHTLEQHDEDPGHNAEETLVSKIFREIIGPFILQRSTQICALLLYLVYISLAIGGCLNIKEGLDPKLLVRESFYLSKFYEIIDETFWREGLQMQVVVNNPPDLFNPDTRKGFDEMMADFEGTQYTMNPNATMIWLRAYETHLETEVHELNIQKPNSSEDWYRRCRDWLIVAGGRRLWQMDMVWANTSFEETPKITAFRFQLGLRNYRTPTDHTHSCKLMRAIAEKHSKFNVTTFHEYYPFADQYLELTPSLFQNMFMDLGTILLVSMVMIPEWRCAVAIVLSIASINVGVLGFMSFWGVNLDSVSIITVIMCIGFAVDLSAHIAYAFSQSYGNSHTRAVAALETLGWPVFLGASSTVLGILLLTLVDSYIVQIFFKTVFLVINFSILHGLIFLPILLMKFVSGVRTRDGEEDNKKNALEMEAQVAA